jgi:signal transduction histidine kinase
LSEPRESEHGASALTLEERERVSGNLAVSQKAALVGGGLGALSNVVAGHMFEAVILVVGLAVLLLSVALRRGRLHLSAIVFQIGLVSTIHALAAADGGIHDVATVLYPLAILTAALMLDRGLLIAVTAACVTSAVFLVRQKTPFEWNILVNVTIILVVSAVAVDLLLRDVIHGAAEARTKERRLAEAFAELESRNAELERFTRVVSHDLKSPLVTIRGFLDYVEQDARVGELDRLVQDAERIRTAADRMGHLLDDLLELSRTGRIARPHEDVPFGEVIREARAIVGGRLSASGLEVEVHPEAETRVVRGDRARLVELAQNLLDNAAKFTGDQPSPRVVVALRDIDDGPGPVFTVTDNGAGIDPAHRERIFDLFHKLDPAAEGSGLGLALVRRIVETHGGRIWVESEGRGRGSTFCFTLPPGQGVAG